jgi:abortive infection bacteriophage resistance protein
MKETAISHLHSALKHLKQDYTSLEVRNLILTALEKLEKKVKKKTAYDEAVKAGLSMHNKWWEGIKERALENAKKMKEQETIKDDQNDENVPYLER